MSDVRQRSRAMARSPFFVPVPRAHVAGRMCRTFSRHRPATASPQARRIPCQSVFTPPNVTFTSTRNMYMGAAREASFTRGICREPLYPRAPSVPGTLPDVRSRLASRAVSSTLLASSAICSPASRCVACCTASLRHLPIAQHETRPGVGRPQFLDPAEARKQALLPHPHAPRPSTPRRTAAYLLSAVGPPPTASSPERAGRLRRMARSALRVVPRPAAENFWGTPVGNENLVILLPPDPLSLRTGAPTQRALRLGPSRCPPRGFRGFCASANSPHV
ncbi:hypothetical protein VTO73DRAFT_15059 [Trametes versicolor]